MFMPSTVAYFNRSGQSGGEGGVRPLTTPKWLTDGISTFRREPLADPDIDGETKMH